ncbi:hypothetical protein ABZ490_09105 [Streptomyces sp. NPDC005811]|uniref:hypothetical protein n=1 Tax=Streptomyces sp. NPDC005811 TaxID=3154565 RepID=UPI0033C957FA
MTDSPWPRRLVAATHDVKTEWTRALFDSFGSGGLLAREAPEFGREHLLWALAQLRHTNGRTGRMFTGDTTIADELGYNTNDHPGKRCRDVLTRFGFFTQQGKQGRAANLYLSVPLVLLDDEEAYPTLAGSLHGEVITVADTKPSKPRKTPTPKNGPSRPAEPSEVESVEACPAHPEGDCPDLSDPFSSVPNWGPGACRAALSVQ